MEEGDGKENVMSENKSDQGSVVSDQKTGASEDERLLFISRTIKGVAAMAQVGMTYCIVIPGFGAREDARLGSNYIAPPQDRSTTSIMTEINDNICAILESHMWTVQHMGYSTDAIEGMIDDIVKKAKGRFEEASAGIGQGAGPQ